MDIVTAIETRKSIRAYLNKPVPKDVIIKILQSSLRTPSAVNTQPWNIYVVCGEALDNIKRDNVSTFLSGTKPTTKEQDFQGIFRQRRVDLAKELFKLLNIEREDAVKRKEWAAQGYKYFDAPAAIILTMPTDLVEGTWSLLAMGALMQTICLAAMNYGLGTCIDEQGSAFHEVLKKYIELPEEQSIVMSIALGYPDFNSPANRLISQRTSLDEVAHLIGF